MDVFMVAFLGMLFCTCNAAQEQLEKESDKEAQFNPLLRALSKLRELYETKGANGNYCIDNPAVATECAVCEALEMDQDMESCCADLALFSVCHKNIGDFLDKVDDINKEDGSEDSEENTSDEESDKEQPHKRYGPVFASLNWFPSRKQKTTNKRYGSLGGFDWQTKPQSDKRYGYLGGFDWRSKPEFDKRYGSLGGFSWNQRPKRYGNLGGFSWTYGRNRPGAGKRYGNLGGFNWRKIYSRNPEKRYGNLGGFSWNSKKQG